MSEALTSNDAPPLAKRAYQSIRDRILRGNYPIGHPLSRRSIAEDLGMSPLPVAEALQRLEGDGLVESKPQVGTRVRVPTEQDIRDHYVVREALESQASRLFSERASAEERQGLLSRAAELDELFAVRANGNSDQQFQYFIHQTHVNFHLKIAEGAGSRALREAIDRQQVLIFNWLYDMLGTPRPLPTDFHRLLATCLVERDALAADEAMRLHVRFGLEPLLEQLRTMGSLEHSWRHKRSRSNGNPPPSLSSGDASI